METCELVSSLIMSCSWSPNPNGVVQFPAEEKNPPKLYLQLKEEEQVRQKVYFYKKFFLNVQTLYCFRSKASSRNIKSYKWCITLHTLHYVVHPFLKG